MPLSYSQLKLYQTCPRQYEFACIKKIPRTISAGESFGSSVHNTLKQFGDLEQSGQRTVESGQLELFAESVPSNTDHCPLSTDTLQKMWNTSFIVQGYASKADADAARKRGEGCMQQFYDWWKQKDRTVRACEKSFSIDIGDTTLKGRFDRVEEDDNGLHVIDYKTTKPRSQEEVDSDLQLSIYALACEEEFQKPCISLSLLHLQEDEYTEIMTTRSDAQLDEARKIIEQSAHGIGSKQFEPTPSETTCAYCPYKNVCDSAIIIR